MSQPAQRPYTHASHRRKQRQKRRKRIISISVLIAMVLLFTALGLILLGLNEKTPASSSVAAPSSTPRPASSVSQPEPEPEPEPEGPVLPAVTDPALDVEGLPPLYNRHHGIPSEVSSTIENELELISGSNHYMAPQAAAAFMQMQAAAAAEGLDLTPVSGYRSNTHQTSNYNSSIQRYLNQGYSQEDAVESTEWYYARPGTSEHEAGLAMDIGLVDDSFAYTSEYAWLQEHCTEYGFIYRYPAEEELKAITRIAWEPWHYRFVGRNHAQNMTALGIQTLEEYIAYYEGMTLEELDQSGNRYEAG